MHNLTETDILFWMGSILIVIVGYAEIHFQIPGLPSKIYKKEPEILFDLPHRATMGDPIPLFLFVKDAHLFPAHLQKTTVVINAASNKSIETVHHFLIDQRVETPFFSHTLWIDPAAFPSPEDYFITVTLTYKTPRGLHRLYQDNYNGIAREPFILRIAGAGLPALPGWHWGDLHIHSNFTNDAVEFGAPVHETALCARSLGLAFIAITDHSFDLDDDPEDYRIADPDFRKWGLFLESCAAINRSIDDICIIPGEEVSVGNSRGENVHCLVLGNAHPYPGTGDSGDSLWRNKPTLTLPELIGQVQAKDPKALIIAAHPFDEPPLAQRRLLNRGHWHSTDLTLPQLNAWQILNGRDDRYFAAGLVHWRKQLLSGKRYAIVAGTDAHGNFNNFRQVSIPLLKMVFHRQQLLGQTRTGIYCPKKPGIGEVLRAVQKKSAIVSNGPAADMVAFQDDQIYRIGDSLRAGIPFRVQISALSSQEFGQLFDIQLFHAIRYDNSEKIRRMTVGENCHRFQETIFFSGGLPAGYLRLEVKARGQNGQHSFCLTNPIWIE